MGDSLNEWSQARVEIAKAASLWNAGLLGSRRFLLIQSHFILLPPDGGCGP